MIALTDKQEEQHKQHKSERATDRPKGEEDDGLDTHEFGDGAKVVAAQVVLDGHIEEDEIVHGDLRAGGRAHRGDGRLEKKRRAHETDT